MDWRGFVEKVFKGNAKGLGEKGVGTTRECMITSGANRNLRMAWFREESREGRMAETAV